MKASDIQVKVEMDLDTALQVIASQERRFQELEQLVKEWRTEQPKSIWSVTYLERGRCADELGALLKGEE